MKGRLLVWTVVLCLCAVCALAACAPVEEKPQEEDQGTLYVAMSYNIRTIATDSNPHTWPERMPKVVAQITAYRPHLLAMQEATVLHMMDLTPALEEEYGILFTGRETALWAEGNPVLYRLDTFVLVDSGTFWLSETPSEVSKYTGAACYRICTWAVLEDITTGQRLCLASTHLDHESAEARLFGASVLKQELSNEYPLVLMGDFNESADGVAYASLCERFTDAGSGLNEPSFHGFGSVTEGLPIDFVFVEGEWTVEDCCILKESGEGGYTSDHYALLAKLWLQNN